MATRTQEKAQLLTQAQAGVLLGVSKPTMQRLVASGALKPVRLPGLLRPKYRRADVEDLIRGASP